MLTHYQASKPKQNDKNTGPEKHQPSSQALFDQTQTIHPSVLARAIEDPRGNIPETILQLQLMYGNQAVDRMIAAADRRVSQSSVDPETLQRTIGNQAVGQLLVGTERIGTGRVTFQHAVGGLQV